MSSVEVTDSEMYNNLKGLNNCSVWPPFKLSIFYRDGTISVAVIECTGCNKMKCGDYDVTYENRATDVVLTWNNYNTLVCSSTSTTLNGISVSKAFFTVSVGQFDDCKLNKYIYNNKYDSMYPVNTTDDSPVDPYGDLRVPAAIIAVFPDSVFFSRKSRWYSIGKCGAVVMIEFVPQKSGNPKGAFYWLTDTGNSRVCFPISVDVEVSRFNGNSVDFNDTSTLNSGNITIKAFPLYSVTHAYLTSYGGPTTGLTFLNSMSLPSAYRTTTRITSALAFQLTRQ